MTISDWVQQNLNLATPFFIYLLLAVLVFIETGVLIAFFIPGDSILFAAGFVAATRSDTNIVILIFVIVFSAFMGDQIGFVLGRKYGRNYLGKSKRPLIQKMIKRSENFYEKYGWTAVVLARFYPWIRTFIPPIAGLGKMDYYKFLTANAFGAVLWGAGITTLGFYAASFPSLDGSSSEIAGFFVVLTILITVKNYVKSKRNHSAPK
jgi:membrane-associated protein